MGYRVIQLFSKKELKKDGSYIKKSIFFVFYTGKKTEQKYLLKKKLNFCA